MSLSMTSIAAESDDSFEISSIANTCRSEFFGLYFLIYYVPVVNVDSTKPLAKYEGFCCLYTLHCRFSLFSNSLSFLGPAAYSILKVYPHSIHLLSEKYLGIK